MIYNLYIYNRQGVCLYYYQWNRPMYTFKDNPLEDRWVRTVAHETCWSRPYATLRGSLCVRSQESDVRPALFAEELRREDVAHPVRRRPAPSRTPLQRTRPRPQSAAASARRFVVLRAGSTRSHPGFSLESVQMLFRSLAPCAPWATAWACREKETGLRCFRTATFTLHLFEVRLLAFFAACLRATSLPLAQRTHQRAAGGTWAARAVRLAIVWNLGGRDIS